MSEFTFSNLLFSPGTKAPKSKAPKDPNAPKKPLTAYFAWMNQNRSRIKEENPGSSLGEIAKIAGKEWKEVDEEEKSELEATYKEEMEEYREKMKDYVPDRKYQNGKAGAKSKTSSAGSKRKGSKAKSTAEVYDDSSDGEGGASTSSLSCRLGSNLILECVPMYMIFVRIFT